MSDSIGFTHEERAVIDGVIGMLYPKMADEALRKAYWDVHTHLQANTITQNDLKRIENALELADPGHCTSCHKESYRELTVIRLKAQAMRCVS